MKEINMKNTIFLWFVFAGITIHLPAQQLSPFGAASASQQFIEDAVKNGIFILRRCYRLQDTTAQTPTYFGWQNQNWFGETYSLGIKVKEGYYLSDKAARPWIYDAKFEQYATSDKLVPVISASEYKMMEDSIFTVLPNHDDRMKEISAHRFYLAQDTAVFQQKGFYADGSDGAKKGWLVWLVTDRLLEEQNHQTPEFLIYRSELTFESGKESCEIKDPATGKKILGGFYFLPKFTDVGQINFYLCGILHHENDKWHVVRPNSPVQTKPHQGALTPIIDVNHKKTE